MVEKNLDKENSNFLFHEVSEREREEIKQEAKRLMDSFYNKLNKIKQKMPEHFVERDEFEREEGEGKNEEENKDFRQRMFDNAPNKNQDFIIAEKKKW